MAKRKVGRSGGSEHSTRITELRARYVVDPVAARAWVQAALAKSKNAEEAADVLGVSRRSIYRTLEDDEALMAWWKEEQERRAESAAPEKGRAR